MKKDIRNNPKAVNFFFKIYYYVTKEEPRQNQY